MLSKILQNCKVHSPGFEYELGSNLLRRPTGIVSTTASQRVPKYRIQFQERTEDLSSGLILRGIAVLAKWRNLQDDESERENNEIVSNSTNLLLELDSYGNGMPLTKR